MFKPAYRITPYLLNLIDEASSLKTWVELAPLHVAWLPQRPHLFHGSVLDNLRLGRPDASDELVKAAVDYMVKMAQ